MPADLPALPGRSASASGESVVDPGILLSERHEARPRGEPVAARRTIGLNVRRSGTDLYDHLKSLAVSPDITLRTTLRPGDLGTIVHLHGVLYAREYGFDSTFEAYVAGPLADFVRTPTPRQRLWIAERNDLIVGCVAIVPADDATAQLRWFLVHPAARGLGLGKRLLHEAVAFAHECHYNRIFLWTVSALTAAAHLYTAAGFHKVETHPAHLWGVEVIEERYERALVP
jgi:GNAT superfamily N-acetyltransferase